MWTVGYLPAIYGDGRAPSLERQVIGAWTGANMGAAGKDGRPSTDDIAKNLNAIPGYRQQFQSVFGGPATPDTVAKALAAFMRTIVATKERSAWMRFMTGDKKALSARPARLQGLPRKSQVRQLPRRQASLRHAVPQRRHRHGRRHPRPRPLRRHQGRKGQGALRTRPCSISPSPPLLPQRQRAPSTKPSTSCSRAAKIILARQDEPQAGENFRQEKADLMAFLKSLDVTYDIAEPKLP
jgi:hypothetical protein